MAAGASRDHKIVGTSVIGMMRRGVHGIGMNAVYLPKLAEWTRVLTPLTTKEANHVKSGGVGVSPPHGSIGAGMPDHCNV
jgi:hypothetical protein